MTKIGYTQSDLKKLIEAAINALYGLGGSGNPTHDKLADALKPFTRKEFDNGKKI